MITEKDLQVIQTMSNACLEAKTAVLEQEELIRRLEVDDPLTQARNELEFRKQTLLAMCDEYNAAKEDIRARI